MVSLIYDRFNLIHHRLLFIAKYRNIAVLEIENDCNRHIFKFFKMITKNKENFFKIQIQKNEFGEMKLIFQINTNNINSTIKNRNFLREKEKCR
jgi:hypothetical protein